MENLKIRVNNEAESKEAQELFFKLGFQWRGLKSPLDLFYPTSLDNYYIVLTKGSKEMQIAGAFRDGLRAWKETTLPELRAMVNPMKEYLIPDDGGYRVAVQDAGLPIAEDWIEIPEGAEALTKEILDSEEMLLWWRDNFNKCIGHDDQLSNYEIDVYNHLERSPKPVILWQRATHPEELPFIDDEPKYTDDEVKYMDENGQGRLQSINDQYAEIEQVRQVEIHDTVDATQASGDVDATLTERQSQYGCYEDVAHATQQILSALRIGNYDKLPAPMKESLHMIASKMARIVNGDPEYLDNWHDIGGYAKLIEKLIKGE